MIKKNCKLRFNNAQKFYFTMLMLFLLTQFLNILSAKEKYEYSRDLGFFTKLTMDFEMPPVNHHETNQYCTAGCHMAYPAGLLPSRSWGEIMNRLDNHYGVEVKLSKEVIHTIRSYLTTNAAEVTESKVSVKILDSLADNDIPMRILKIPYMAHKHHDIEAEVYRDSIRFPGNCVACHLNSEKDGNFEEKFAEIPGLK